jgi:glycosyltransferase involved in cell wall biosynthesis
MNILMFNNHVPYIYMLAKTGHNIIVLNPQGRKWFNEERPKPPNVMVVENAQEVIQFVTNLGRIDRVILQDVPFVQTPQGLIHPERFLIDQILPNVPKTILFHNSFNTMFRGVPEKDRPKVKQFISEYFKDCTKVFISKMKQDSYGIDGHVILPCIDTEEFGGYRGISGKYLTCVNNFRARDFMNNFNKTVMACHGVDLTIMGRGEGQPNIYAKNFEDYKNILKEHKAYVCLNNKEFEDGYNLSSLESMATGLPLVTLDNPSSPVINGVNGFKSDNLGDINKFLTELSTEEAIRLGRGARATIKDNFTVQSFVDNWNKALQMP